MVLFMIAFFGAMLLFPLYFQQVRGEDALHGRACCSRRRASAR